MDKKDDVRTISTAGSVWSRLRCFVALDKAIKSGNLTASEEKYCPVSTLDTLQRAKYDRAERDSNAALEAIRLDGEREASKTVKRATIEAVRKAIYAKTPLKVVE